MDDLHKLKELRDCWRLVERKRYYIFPTPLPQVIMPLRKNSKIRRRRTRGYSESTRSVSTQIWDEINRVKNENESETARSEIPENFRREAGNSGGAGVSKIGKVAFKPVSVESITMETKNVDLNQTPPFEVSFQKNSVTNTSPLKQNAQVFQALNPERVNLKTEVIPDKIAKQISLPVNLTSDTKNEKTKNLPPIKPGKVSPEIKREAMNKQNILTISSTENNKSDNSQAFNAAQLGYPRSEENAKPVSENTSQVIAPVKPVNASPQIKSHTKNSSGVSSGNYESNPTEVVTKKIISPPRDYPLPLISESNNKITNSVITQAQPLEYEELISPSNSSGNFTGVTGSDPGNISGNFNGLKWDEPYYTSGNFTEVKGYDSGSSGHFNGVKSDEPCNTSGIFVGVKWEDPCNSSGNFTGETKEEGNSSGIATRTVGKEAGNTAGNFDGVTLGEEGNFESPRLMYENLLSKNLARPLYMFVPESEFGDEEGERSSSGESISSSFRDDLSASPNWDKSANFSSDLTHLIGSESEDFNPDLSRDLKSPKSAYDAAIYLFEQSQLKNFNSRNIYPDVDELQKIIENSYRRLTDSTTTNIYRESYPRRVYKFKLCKIIKEPGKYKIQSSWFTRRSAPPSLNLIPGHVDPDPKAGRVDPDLMLNKTGEVIKPSEQDRRIAFGDGKSAGKELGFELYFEDFKKLYESGSITRSTAGQFYGRDSDEIRKLLQRTQSSSSPVEEDNLENIVALKPIPEHLKRDYVVIETDNPKITSPTYINPSQLTDKSNQLNLGMNLNVVAVPTRLTADQANCKDENWIDESILRNKNTKISTESSGGIGDKKQSVVAPAANTTDPNREQQIRRQQKREAVIVKRWSRGGNVHAKPESQRSKYDDANNKGEAVRSLNNFQTRDEKKGTTTQLGARTSGIDVKFDAATSSARPMQVEILAKLIDENKNTDQMSILKGGENKKPSPNANMPGGQREGISEKSKQDYVVVATDDNKMAANDHEISQTSSLKLKDISLPEDSNFMRVTQLRQQFERQIQASKASQIKANVPRRSHSLEPKSPDSVKEKRITFNLAGPNIQSRGGTLARAASIESITSKGKPVYTSRWNSTETFKLLSEPLSTCEDKNTKPGNIILDARKYVAEIRFKPKASKTEPTVAVTRPNKTNAMVVINQTMMPAIPPADEQSIKEQNRVENIGKNNSKVVGAIQIENPTTNGTVDRKTAIAHKISSADAGSSRKAETPEIKINPVNSEPTRGTGTPGNADLKVTNTENSGKSGIPEIKISRAASDDEEVVDADETNGKEMATRRPVIARTGHVPAEERRTAASGAARTSNLVLARANYWDAFISKNKSPTVEETETAFPKLKENP